MDPAVLAISLGSVQQHSIDSVRVLELPRSCLRNIVYVSIVQDTNKAELTSSADLQAAYCNSSYSLHGDLLLLATADNTPLSGTTLAAAPLRLVHDGPVPLPVIGNFRCYISGPYKVPAYNCYANVFTPEKQARWGDTVVLHLPNCSGGKDILPVGHWASIAFLCFLCILQILHFVDCCQCFCNCL